jgi:hypothetical protein
VLAVKVAADCFLDYLGMMLKKAWSETCDSSGKAWQEGRQEAQQKRAVQKASTADQPQQQHHNSAQQSSEDWDDTLMALCDILPWILPGVGWVIAEAIAASSVEVQYRRAVRWWKWSRALYAVSLAGMAAYQGCDILSRESPQQAWNPLVAVGLGSCVMWLLGDKVCGTGGW